MRFLPARPPEIVVAQRTTLRRPIASVTSGSTVSTSAIDKPTIEAARTPIAAWLAGDRDSRRTSSTAAAMVMATTIAAARRIGTTTGCRRNIEAVVATAHVSATANTAHWTESRTSGECWRSNGFWGQIGWQFNS